MSRSILEMLFRTKKEGTGEKEAESGLGKLNDAFKGLTGVSLGGAAALGVVAGVLKTSIWAAAEAEREMAQLDAVLRSTGEAAGVSREEIMAYSTEMERLTGIDGDLITRAQSVLLTFTQIGKEVFPDATTAAMNMSAALGIDLHGAITMVGKALNDPIVGATALRRVGVSLTEQQMEQIRVFTENNDILSAQKVILAELAVEYGGAAEAIGDTFSGAVNRAKVNWGALMEVMGTSTIKVLRPAIEAFNDWAENTVDLATAQMALEEAMERGVITQHEAQIRIGALKRGFAEAGETLEWVTTTTEAFDEAAWEAMVTTGDWVSRLAMMPTAAQEAADATDDLVEAAERAKQGLDDLKLFVSGPLGKEYDNFTSRQEELNTKMQETKARIDELSSKPWLPRSEREELEKLKSEYDELTQKYGENAEAHEAANKRIMLNLVMQRAAIGDVTSDELLLVTDLATSWGLMDEKTRTAVLGIDKAFEDLASGKGLQMTRAELLLLLDTIERMTGTHSIHFDISTSGHMPSMPGPGPGGGYQPPGAPVPFAAGGDMVFTRPTMFVAGEYEPERVSVRRAGDAGGGGFTIIIQEAHIRGMDDIYLLARQLDELRREAEWRTR